jgi:fructosamine-3-kinase
VTRNGADGWLPQLAAALEVTPGPPRPLGAGIWRVSAGGRELVAKTGRGVADEAAGLEALALVPSGPPVPGVVLAQPDLLVTTWVDQGPRTTGHEVMLGRQMAGLHVHRWSTWGGGSCWVGACPVDPEPADDGVAYFNRRLMDLSSRCGLEQPAAGLASRIGDRLPVDGPSLVHGDLWWGNVLWGADGQPWLIDPSVHGGYPEEDLAMLGLFGPVPDRTIEAYLDVRSLPAGWEERVELFRLFPLLVHAVLFGGGYRSQAEDIIRRLT